MAPHGSELQAGILIVDDDEAIRVLFSAHLRSIGYRTSVASTGVAALDQLTAEPFDLIISDIRMPVMNGMELLEHVGKRYPGIGMLMLSGCDDLPTAVGAMKLGSLDYLQKPCTLDGLAAAVSRALDKIRRSRSETIRLASLEDGFRTAQMDLVRARELLSAASQSTMEALVAALDAREHETQAHSKRVSEYTHLLASRMGIDAARLDDIRRGAMLHDVGKIGVSDAILLKRGPLDAAEWTEMRKHPQTGYSILVGIESLRAASGLVLAHHESVDGSGYPFGLKGESIPIEARIFAVVDCFDAITSDRPYRAAGAFSAACAEIQRCSGSQFDPAVVDAFLNIPESAWDEIRGRFRTAAASTAIKAAT